MGGLKGKPMPGSLSHGTGKEHSLGQGIQLVPWTKRTKFRIWHSSNEGT